MQKDKGAGKEPGSGSGNKDKFSGGRGVGEGRLKVI